MNNLKLSYKIVLINIAIAIVITILIVLADSGNFSVSGETAFAFGLVCLGIGLLDLFVGFIFLLAGAAEWRNGFLLSGAALLLLSGISCGGGVIHL